MQKLAKLARRIATLGITAALIVGFTIPAMAAPVRTNAQAEEIALGVYPGATVRYTEYEQKKNGATYYEVNLIVAGDVRVEVKIDAATGTIRAGYERNLLEVATITPTQARNTALNLYPGATITKTELEYEKGVLTYEISLTQTNGRRAEVYIDAATGTVTRNKTK